jgi:DNA-binding transcriptional LysR family regulator
MATQRRVLDHFRAMAVFAKTVESGSFRAAAQAFGLSPSVVSHHIAHLEASLEVALLYRTTRKLTLTEEGKELFAAAQKMVAAAESGLEQLSQSASSPSGTLSITAPAALIAETLFEDLAAFAATFPRVALAMHFSDTPADLIGEGIDVAIRAGTLKDSNLKSKKLFDFQRTLVASREYVATKPPPRHPRELGGWDWIRLRSRPSVATFARRGVRVAFVSRISVDSGAAALGFARQGLGLATVPTAMAEPDLRSGRVVAVLPDWPLEAPSVYAVWPANASRTSLTQRLISFLAKRRQITSS